MQDNVQYLKTTDKDNMKQRNTGKSKMVFRK